MSELLKKYAPALGAIVYPKVQSEILGASDMGQYDYSTEGQVCRAELIELFEEEFQQPVKA